MINLSFNNTKLLNDLFKFKFKIYISGIYDPVPKLKTNMSPSWIDLYRKASLQANKVGSLKVRPPYNKIFTYLKKKDNNTI